MMLSVNGALQRTRDLPVTALGASTGLHRMPRILQNELAALGRDRITALKSLDPSALCALPKSQGEDVIVRGKKVRLTVYRASWDGRTLIVVQLYRHIFLGYGHVFVFGFNLGKDGTITEAEPEMLYDYS
jgi:hypothetical protein